MSGTWKIATIVAADVVGFSRLASAGKGDRMRRREFIGLAGAAAAWPLMAQAQEAGRTYRLGFLFSNTRYQPDFAAMFESLRRSGYIEGQNLIVDWRAYGRQPDRAPELAAELVKAKPDVLYATTEIGIKAMLRATTTIPIVGLTQDMVGSGFATSLAHPTGNVTGVSLLQSELDGKRQEILCDALPGLKHMAALKDTNNTAEARLLEMRDAMHARGGELSVYRVAKPDEIGPAIASAKAAGAEALNVLSSPIAPGQSPDHHWTRRRASPSRHLSISGRGGGGRFRRLRSQYRRSLPRYGGLHDRQAVARRQARRYSDRAADEIRARDQSEDGERARADASLGVPGARGRGDRMRRRVVAP
jgi:putative ABC transport system substrate-binding protein